MDKPKKEQHPKVYRVALPDGQIVLFVPCPRQARKARGHHPDNHYARWRNPKRLLRRQLIRAGVILTSGRSWIKYKKEAQKAYRQYQIDKTMGGMLNVD